MRSMRLTIVVLAALFAVADPLSAQCTSLVRDIGSRGTAGNLVSGPIAWTGTMLGVSSVDTRNGSVWFSLYDESGTLLYPSLKIPPSEGAEIVGLVWNGNHFGLFFKTTDKRLILRRISTAAELIGVPIMPLDKLRLEPNDEVDLYWSTTRDAYVMARTVNAPPRALFLTIINADGTVRSNVQQANITPAANSFVHLAETASGIIGLFYERDGTRDVMLQRFEAGQKEINRKVWTPGIDLVVTSYDNRFVLARTVLQTNGNESIRWKTVDNLGFDVGVETRLLIGSGKEVEPQSLIVGHNGELALSYFDSRDGVATMDPSFRLRRFSPANGELIADTYFAAADRTRHRATSKHDFVWTGNAYVASVVREIAGADAESYLVRLCPLVVDADGPRSVRVGEPVTFTASAAGGVPSYNYHWTWGDLGFAAGPELTLTFGQVGTFTATLHATDDTGTVVRTTFSVQIVAPEEPVKKRRRAVRH